MKEITEKDFTDALLKLMFAGSGDIIHNPEKAAKVFYDLALQMKGEQVGMRWVKASERLPDSFTNKYVIRFPLAEDGDYVISVRSEIKEWVDAAYTIEWLDESPQQPKESVDVDGLKEKILTAIKQKWVKEFGSLEDDPGRDGFFVAGFVRSVLNEMKWI